MEQELEAPKGAESKSSNVISEIMVSETWGQGSSQPREFKDPKKEPNEITMTDPFKLPAATGDGLGESTFTGGGTKPKLDDKK